MRQKKFPFVDSVVVIAHAYLTLLVEFSVKGKVCAIYTKCFTLSST
jgi:hypothetical protein